MTTVQPDLGLIDSELRAAARFLDSARRTYRATPSEANARTLERARADIDRLLDHRLAATH